MDVRTRNRPAARGQGPVGQGGFSLIEVMIVVVIIAVLAAIALPIYTRHITRTHRVAAEACLSEYANYMERFYTTNLRYDQDTSGTKLTLPTLDCAGASQTGAFYAYTFTTTPTTSTFQVQAQPQGVQASRDTACGTLSLKQDGTRAATGSDGAAACWK